MQSDIKNQVSSLMEQIISLQEQVNILKAKLENSGVTSDQENHSNQNVNSSSNDQSVIIESVKENMTPREGPVTDEPSIVPGRNSYSGAVQKTTERQHKTKAQSEQNQSTEQAAVFRTTDRNNAHANSQNQLGKSSQQKQTSSSSNTSAKTLNWRVSSIQC